MKKFVAAVCLSALVLSAAAGQTADVVMLNVKKYSSYFLNPNGTMQGKYGRAASEEDYFRIASLDGDLYEGLDLPKVDSPLEVALLSYSAGAVDLRPPEAVAMLPANSRTSEIKLAAATYKELQEVRFLDANNRDRIGRYEAMLKFITDRNRVTQSEINSALCAGIADTVDEEFNKIGSFILGTPWGGCSAYLSRRTDGYVLDCEGYLDNSGKGNIVKQVTATSLDGLITAMRTSNLFSSSGDERVRAQAALIPAVAKPAEMNAVKQALFNFYSAPGQQTYKVLKDLYIKYASFASLAQVDSAIYSSFLDTVSSLNVELGTRIRN